MGAYTKMAFRSPSTPTSQARVFTSARRYGKDPGGGWSRERLKISQEVPGEGWLKYDML
jgi:hypothetical protein